MTTDLYIPRTNDDFEIPFTATEVYYDYFGNITGYLIPNRPSPTFPHLQLVKS